MTFQPGTDADADEIEARVTDAIAENDVVLFMKGNRLMPQCGYSQRAIELISQHVEEFETVDVLPALPHYREALESESGWETIPQTFVNGAFIGGSDVLAELDERGELAAELDAE